MEWTTASFYLLCAIAGGSVVVIQLVLGLFGLGADHLDAIDGLDAHDAMDVADASDAGMHLFSVRAVSGFILMFGLIGWAGTAAGWPSPLTAFLATLAGATTLVLIAWLLYLQRKLDSSGTLQPESAVGSTAKVYLRIPADNQAQGKITVELQGRTAEYSAFTQGSEIPTGAEVRIVRMSGPGTFEVEGL